MASDESLDCSDIDEPEPYWTGPGYRGEYQCPHGVGHGTHIHGCCGSHCCSRSDFPPNKNNIERTRVIEKKRNTALQVPLPKGGKRMSKRSSKLERMRRTVKPVGPITRRQQVAAIRQVKGQEIAAAVSKNIRETVKQEVETQLMAIKDTMLSLIDRVVDLESVYYEDDGTGRPERAEALPVQQDDQVVPYEGFDREDRSSYDEEEGPTGR